MKSNYQTFLEASKQYLGIHGRELLSQDGQDGHTEEEAEEHAKDDGTRQPEIIKLVSILLNIERLGNGNAAHRIRAG